MFSILCFCYIYDGFLVVKKGVWVPLDGTRWSISSRS